MAKTSAIFSPRHRATALAVLLASTLTTGPALATVIAGAPYGGQGGTGSSGVGGAGGTLQSPAGNGSGNSGGGGGGPGGSPGSGGAGSGGAGGGGGGAGGMNGSLAGTPVGSDGDNGSNARADAGAGGGGAGGIGAIQTASGTISQDVKGGAGGAGGTGSGGGDGGDGGSGLLVNRASGPVAVENNVRGGNGGAGGNAGGVGGNSGNGGTGLLVNQSPGPVVIEGNVSGGNGGAAGSSSGGDLDGYAGYGGDGVYASNPLAGTSSTTIVNRGVIVGGNGDGYVAGGGVAGRDLTLTNAGTIRGGLGDNGNGARADAIRFFPGGPNRLNLRKGSTIVGTVAATSGDDTLTLGGSGNSSFDVSKIGGLQQYRGFESFQKTGSSTWTLTGKGNQQWTVTNGTLQVGASASASADSGGNVDVQSGGTLSGYGSAGGDVTIASGATIDPGDIAATGTLSIAGNLAMNGTFSTDIAGINNFDQLAVADTATFGSGSELGLNALSGFKLNAGQSFDVLIASAIDNLVNLGLPSLGSGLTLNASNVSVGGDRALRLSVRSSSAVVAAPEPGSLGLFAIGLAIVGLIGFYRRREFRPMNSL